MYLLYYQEYDYKDISMFSLHQQICMSKDIFMSSLHQQIYACPMFLHIR